MDTWEDLDVVVFNVLHIFTCSLLHYFICVNIGNNRMEELCHLCTIRRVCFFVEVLPISLPWLQIHLARRRISKSIPTNTIHYLIPTEVIFPCWVWVFPKYFSLVSILSLHHTLQHLQYFLKLNHDPYIQPRRLHMQILSMPTCTRPDAVEINDQYFITTLCDTKPFGNSSC